MTNEIQLLEIDASDVDRHLGRPIRSGLQLKEAICVQDIRGWVQAQHNPNPLHFDEEYASKTKFGRIVAPQSFDIACEHNHGVIPALAGEIPGGHELWGGAEWFFYGPRIYPGDRITCERTPYDYKITQTRFAGPTLFQRGDVVFTNQNGETISRMRSTAVRYLSENARRIGLRTGSVEASEDPEFTREELDEIEEQKQEYYRSFHNKPVRWGNEVQPGEKLTRGVLGPHSLVTLTTDWRSYLWNRGWGSSQFDGEYHPYGADGVKKIERVKLDPDYRDMVYHGPARGHLDPKFARTVGMPRGYAFGASMCGWVIDYVSNWAGHEGFITRCKYSARSPILCGDVTYMDGSVSEVGPDPDAPGYIRAVVEVQLSAGPGGASHGTASLDVRFPIKSGS
jgi:hypothetical protein